MPITWTSIRAYIYISYILLLTACGGGGGSDGGASSILVSTNPSTITFATYLNVQKRVSIAYPESWVKNSHFNNQEIPDHWVKSNHFSDAEILMAFFEASEGANDQYLENVLLIKAGSLDEVSISSLRDIQVASSQQINVAGFSGQEDIFDDIYVEEELDLRFMLISFEYHEEAYALLYSAERSVFEKNTEIVREMANTMKLGQVIISDLDLNSDLSRPGKPAIANDGTDFLVVSCRGTEKQPYSTELVGRIVKSDRSMMEEFSIHSMVDIENVDCTSTHNVIFDGNNYLVTYLVHNRVVGKRISTTGDLLDSKAIDISQNPNRSRAFEPTMAFDGGRSFVVWFEFRDYNGYEASDKYEIKGAFIDTSGSVTSSFSIEKDLKSTYPNSNTFSYTPQVAYGNGQFMVVWSPYFFQDVRVAPVPIYGQQLDLSGNLLLPKAVEVRSDTGLNPRYVQIISNDSGYLIGWIEGELDSNVISAGSFNIYARKVSTLGELENGNSFETGIEIAPSLLVKGAIDRREVPKDFLSLSFHDGNYLFLWTSVSSYPEMGVYGVKVSENLSNISEPVSIVGTNADTIYDELNLSKPTQANISFSDDRSLVVWPSRDEVEYGAVEGWFIEGMGF